ncbi:MAG: hydrogenase [Lentisphaerae bacterium]|nr:hydrogenase [Lentisphaerota bacterium]
MNIAVFLHPVSALLLAPLLPGVINRVKAFFAGRNGPPLLQAYWDLWKLFRKGAVYSRTTTWVFRAGPLVNFACMLTALAVLPLGRVPAAVSFAGDMVLLAYLLGLGRFATVAAALDTGSSFEGMGASREVQFAVFAEPALLIGLAALARHAQSLSLSSIYGGLSVAAWAGALPQVCLLGTGLFVLFLAENCRIPVDDPNTHLELTMIHEVMVLDHGSVDFGLVLWGSYVKLWVLGALCVGLVLPGPTGRPAADLAFGVAGLLGLAVVVGIVESVTARVRLLRVPQLLVGAGVLCTLGLLLTFR